MGVGGVGAFGINLLYRGDESRRGTGLFEQTQVGLLASRIGGEVGRIIELRRIHKYTGHHGVAIATGSLNQRKMPLMERTHSRDKADGAALAPKLRHIFAKLTDCT